MAHQHSLLVCEDNYAIAEVLRFVLQRAGFAVTNARTGTAAIELAENQPFDLVITDYEMPGKNGEDVCRAVRSSPLNSEVPLILCTAKAFESYASEMQRSYRIAKVFGKPFSPLAITRLAQELLLGVSCATPVREVSPSGSC